MSSVEAKVYFTEDAVARLLTVRAFRDEVRDEVLTNEKKKWECLYLYISLFDIFRVKKESEK